MIAFVWAEDEKGAIGRKGHLPWHLPADLKAFKQRTMGHPILMGKNTFLSLPHLLPGRKHLVLTHSQELRKKYHDNEQVQFFSSWSEVNAYLKKHQTEKICVIGGLSIFAGLKDKVDVLYRTVIHAAFSADTYMCKLDYNDFDLIKKEVHHADSRNKYDYDFLTYQRKSEKE